ncbi:unnamed protein product [Pedinophyceae sp. YPF-701]|nr:unnamed protein product [Pedinophyceae sp. YPF-701]
MFGSRSQDKLMDQIFNLKFMSKQMTKAATKCEKEQKSERNKVKKAIEKGNLEGARIYGQNAIRKKEEQLNWLRLGSQLDAVSSQLESQAKMSQVTSSMRNVVSNLDKILKATPIEKVQMNMDKFENIFETLNVQTNAVSGAFKNQMALSTPADEVDQLVQEVATEHQLELNLSMPDAPAKQAEAAPAQRNDDLTSRLAALTGR